MSHFLFIRNQATIPPSLREVFTAPEQIIVTCKTATEAQSALERGVFDFVFIYADSGEDALRRNLRDIRKMHAGVFIVVLSPEYSLSGETTAFDEGADLYFAEPLPSQSLRRILALEGPATESPSTLQTKQVENHTQETRKDNASTLRTLRDLSQILSFSLDYQAFTQHFILKLRDHISFSRIGIFIESSGKQTVVKNSTVRHLRCIASLGLPADLVKCFQLNRDTGIGKELFKQPRILQRSNLSSTNPGNQRNTPEKEFNILGCELAIPISDREGTIGVAIINGPVTGRSYTDDELELFYILMEELGLAIGNSRLHSELAQHGQLIENVLHSMSNGALVCGEDLQILYANDAARRFLNVEHTDEARNIEFAELPPQLAAPIHRAVEKGELPAPFTVTGPDGEGIYNISIFHLTQKGEFLLLPRPTMIIVEDYTKIEANKQSAINTTKSELIALIAERFAHEIRNSLVPLSTHAQLIDKKIEQPKFRASLKSALIKETGRIKRFSEQMLYMAQSSIRGSDSIDLAKLIENAFSQAQTSISNSTAQLVCESECHSPVINGDPEALTYAFEEIFINSMQAEPGEQEIRVSLIENNEGILQVKLKDGGPGISKDVAIDAAEPFFTTRNTGIGLGLSVAKKIISGHGGYLRLHERVSELNCDIEIELPLLLTTA